MRIDIGANSIRADLAPNKSNADIFEMKNRGEYVRGKILDVNQDIVLIQSSTGKEFVANTVIPMENFIGNEMSFLILMDQEGQLILKPELDQKKQELLHEMKVEDILMKLNRSLTTENREIVRNMIRFGIAVNEETFREVKDFVLAVKILQNRAKEQMNTENLRLPVDILVKEEELEVGISTDQDQPLLSREVSIKEILTLKALKLEVSLQNLRALHEMNEALASKDVDIFGLRKLLQEQFNTSSDMLKNTLAVFDEKQHPFLEQSPQQGQKMSDLEMADVSLLQEKKVLEQKEFKAGIYPLMSESSDKIKNTQVHREMLKELLIEVTSEAFKKSSGKPVFSDRRNWSEAEKEVKLDIEKLSKDLKTILGSLSKESAVGRAIEREILPKTDIMREFMHEFSVNILPFSVDKYENIAQYYIQKKKSSKKREEGITVAFSLDTFHYGNVKAFLNYQTSTTISVDIRAENEKYEVSFRAALGELKELLKQLGYTQISLTTGLISDRLKTVAEDKIYPNFDSKSFETWV